MRKEANEIDGAVARIGERRRPVLDRLAGAGTINFIWYLREKIIRPKDDEQVRDNERVLKYAYNFCIEGGRVEFLREGQAKSPDLMIEIAQHRFYMEIKKFRLNSVSSAYPVSKMVDSVRDKSSQLPFSEIGVVTIDNFDLDLEWDHEAGLTHNHIVDAFCELKRLVAANPEDWRRPSGVILAANTSGGVSSGLPRIPHFVWMNEHSEVAIPSQLAKWVSSSLPDGSIFRSWDNEYPG